MISIYNEKDYRELRVDCENCFGLCCIALYFSVSQGFPTDKEAGEPCINLQADFSCSVHKNLREMGLKGCIAYDCFGAGQKVSQHTCSGNDWLQAPESAKKMFDAFLIMRQLHEMKWYLAQSLMLQTDNIITENISSLLDETDCLTFLDIEELLLLDMSAHRTKVNILLNSTSELVRTKAHSKNNNSSINRNSNSQRLDYLGADLRKTNLRGADLRGACLIAADLRGLDLSGADFIGSDLRDTDLRGANLTNSIFLTQSQINTAKGDSYTILPSMLTRPNNWQFHEL